MSDERRRLLDAFEEALYTANLVINLTRVPREVFWVRHVVDSLLIQDLISEGSSVLDIGSGPGFPAWPLAWARPDLSVTALDSNSKAVAFLGQSPLPNLEVARGRAEDWGVRDRFDVVTGRALAPLLAQLEVSAPPAKVGGLVVPMRTEADREAIEGAPVRVLGLKLERIEEKRLPGGGALRLLPLFRKVERTPQRFPRSWTEIKYAALK